MGAVAPDADFEAFAAEHTAALLRLAYLLTRDPSRAEDLVQDGLERALKRWRRDGTPAAPLAYVRRIVVNSYLGWRRRRSSTELVGVAEFAEPSTPDGSDVRAARDLTWRLLGTVEPRQRVVLVLRYYAALPDREIAGYLGCAEAAPATLPARAPRPGSHRPRWTLWAPVAAAAAVIAIVAGLALAQSHLNDAQPTGPGPQPTAPPVPAGYKLVSYHGIEFAVPMSMRVMHATCGDLLPNTVLTQTPGMGSGCTPGGNPKPTAGATYVEVEPPGWHDEQAAQQLATTPTIAAGTHARIGYGTRPDYPGVTGVLVLSEPANQLTVTAPTRGDVATILRSVRRAAVDAVGCPRHEPTLSGNAAATSLAPAGATAISLCGYAGFSADHNFDFWLSGSAAMPGVRVKSLLAQLDALPAGSLAGTGPMHTYVRIGYPNGRVRWLTVYVRRQNPDLVITDGHHSGLARDGGTSTAGNAVSKLLYPNTGWPELAVPQPPSTASGQQPTNPPSPRHR